MDIEVRYTLERGVSGFYTYAIYSHGANYPAGARAKAASSTSSIRTSTGSRWIRTATCPCAAARTCAGVVVHAKEQRIMSTGIYKNSVEHKYSYCAEMYKLPAYGWSSIKDHVGIWFINPSNEYIGGGPTRIDLVCHMGATMLDYWTSGHYAGGAECNIPAGKSGTRSSARFLSIAIRCKPRDGLPSRTGHARGDGGQSHHPRLLDGQCERLV
jgi:rhamnogalacturonan endolyase